MNKTLPFFAFFFAIPLAACSTEPDDTDLEVATTESEADALDAALPPGDFSDLELGARVVGPQGPEVEAAMSNPEGIFADIRSYVACPAGMDPCDPETAPKGTIYTYVHVLVPGGDNDASKGSGNGADNSHVEHAMAFRMIQRAHGFTGNAGYSKAEAMAAMGKMGDVVMTCDDGKLIWTLNSGDGGDQWAHKEPVTFYWQSTLPPAGPAEAYELHVDYTKAGAPGPFPAPDAAASNACTKVPA